MKIEVIFPNGLFDLARMIDSKLRILLMSVNLLRKEINGYLQKQFFLKFDNQIKIGKFKRKESSKFEVSP